MKPGMVTHAFNHSTKEAEVGGFLPLYRERQDSQEYKEKPCVKNKNKHIHV